MKEIRLGQCELNVSQLGLGCIAFGSTINKEMSFQFFMGKWF